MKILIITFAFPPLNRIASSRPYSWAKYWSRLGHEVAVVTKKKTAVDGALNFAYTSDDLAGVRMMELQAWPFRLKKPAPETAEQAKRGSRALTALRDYFLALQAMKHADFWLLPAARKLMRFHRAFPFEIVVSTFGPPGGHLLASYLKEKLNLFWVADYRDLWYGNHFVNRSWLSNRLADIIESKIVYKADLITTVSSGLQARLSERFSCPVVKIENGFDEESLQEAGGERQSYFPDDGKFRIVYTGSLYPGFQDPSPLFEALQLLSQKGFPVENKIEVLFYGSRLGNIQSLVDRYGLSNIVKMPGFVSREDSLRIQRSAGALLFLEWEGPGGESIITGKLFEYLFSGKPILNVGGQTDQSESISLIKKFDAGIIAGKSAPFIAGTLEQMVGKPFYMDQHEEAREALQQYSRKHLAEKMIKIIGEYYGSIGDSGRDIV